MWLPTVLLSLYIYIWLRFCDESSILCSFVCVCVFVSSEFFNIFSDVSVSFQLVAQLLCINAIAIFL